MRSFSFSMKNVKQALTVLMAVALLSGCSEDDPKKEDTPELITKATLTFTPTTGGGTAVVVSATDPDGEGVQDITVDGPINLVAGTQYVLTIDLLNTLVTPGQPGYSITEEVEEEGAEHMFFFAWTGSVFQTPSGDGNIDNRSDAVDYVDLDDNGLPIGLISNWTSAAAAASGTFRVVLKHQPDLKSATSDSATGETDLDITFTVSVN